MIIILKSWGSGTLKEALDYLQIENWASYDHAFYFQLQTDTHGETEWNIVLLEEIYQ